MHYHRKRPYLAENTGSRPIPEVKHHLALSVLGWVIACHPSRVFCEIVAYCIIYFGVVVGGISSGIWNNYHSRMGPLSRFDNTPECVILIYTSETFFMVAWIGTITTWLGNSWLMRLIGSNQVNHYIQLKVRWSDRL